MNSLFVGCNYIGYKGKTTKQKSFHLWCKSRHCFGHDEKLLTIRSSSCDRSLRMLRTSNRGIYQKEFGTDHGLSGDLALTIMAAEISAELPD
jgi:hypothetical protein